MTEGHKDVLVARRSQIPGGLAAWINWDPPTPLIPLERTIQVSERIGVDGQVVRSVDKDKLRKELLGVKGKVQAVTISLLNSWVDGSHERIVADVVKEVLGQEVEVSLSHEVLPELGEYVSEWSAEHVCDNCKTNTVITGKDRHSSSELRGET